MQHRFIFEGVRYLVDDVQGQFNIRLPNNKIVTVDMWLESYPPQIGGVVQVDHNPLTPLINAVEAPAE